MIIYAIVFKGRHMYKKKCKCIQKYAKVYKVCQSDQKNARACNSPQIDILVKMSWKLSDPVHVKNYQTLENCCAGTDHERNISKAYLNKIF